VGVALSPAIVRELAIVVVILLGPFEREAGQIHLKPISACCKHPTKALASAITELSTT
jgi:hypothetical protein